MAEKSAFNEYKKPRQMPGLFIKTKVILYRISMSLCVAVKEPEIILAK
jgi:hypothetical protein